MNTLSIARLLAATLLLAAGAAQAAQPPSVIGHLPLDAVNAPQIPLGGSVADSLNLAHLTGLYKVVLTRPGMITVGTQGEYHTAGMLLDGLGNCLGRPSIGGDRQFVPPGNCDVAAVGDASPSGDHNFRFDNIRLPAGTYFVYVFLVAPDEATPNGFHVYAKFASSAPVSIPIALRGGIDIDGSGKEVIMARTEDPNDFGDMVVGRLLVGGFQFIAHFNPGAGKIPVAINDFNGDGLSDIAIVDVTRDAVFGDVSIFPNFFGTRAIALRQVKKVWDVQAVGDLDGDGFGDMVWRFTGDDGIPNDTGVSYIWFTNGTSVTQVRKRGGAPLNWDLLGAADVNGDGAADMIYISPTKEVRVLMATQNRTCANLSAGTIPAGFTALKVADFSGNGRGDILLLNPTTRVVSLMMLDASNVILPPPTGNPDDPNAACTATNLTVTSTIVPLAPLDQSMGFYAAGDYDGDGIADIVWMREDRALSMWKISVNAQVPVTVTNGLGTAPLGYRVFPSVIR